MVATEDQEILEDVIKNGGRAILTSKNHKTGTDRIYEAFQKLEIQNVDLIMNLQGDEPAIDIEELVSQYTGDIVAHQLGKVIRFAKKRPDDRLNDIVETLKDDLATLLVAPSRSRFFNGGVE